MSVEVFQVDAFTREPFRGNPAAVCLLDSPREVTWMQSFAKEMNLSETAFLLEGNDGYQLRWFTPACEVELCGHATLASAHILWETGRLMPDEQARFHTLSGLLTAAFKGDEVVLNFPATPVEPTAAPAGLEEALGAPVLFTGRNAHDYLVEVDSAEILRSLAPDFEMLKAITSRGVIVTCLSDTPQFIFLSRFFAPGVGIDEDPVTGAAHCTLGPFWGQRLGLEEMMAYQASARGGSVQVRLAGERVHLGGQAVTVLHGELVEAYARSN